MIPDQTPTDGPLIVETAAGRVVVDICERVELLLAGEIEQLGMAALALVLVQHLRHAIVDGDRAELDAAIHTLERYISGVVALWKHDATVPRPKRN